MNLDFQTGLWETPRKVIQLYPCRSCLFPLFVFVFFCPYWTDDDGFSIKVWFTKKRSSQRREDKVLCPYMSDRDWDCPHFLSLLYLDMFLFPKIWSRYSYARMMHSTFSRTNRHVLMLTLMLVFSELPYVFQLFLWRNIVRILIDVSDSLTFCKPSTKTNYFLQSKTNALWPRFTSSPRGKR